MAMNSAIPRPYDTSIHSNPDARAWAKLFEETWREVYPNVPPPNLEWMLGWFANAMMAMHDHILSQIAKDGSSFRITATEIINRDLARTHLPLVP